ncbi:elongation of very long chain fatty acids protein 7 [Plutella xylostella]|uniref:elongation of very long chain fatty acids protein 7 n=1 Tax=Plutella xylostella TaxID=51655 RepID=UPI00203291D1|nr:elongation of very long chain fatty acids protein 7 [Plutella xylostella]
MATKIGLRSPDWGVSMFTSTYPEVDSYPLMSSPVPVLLIISSYLLFIFKIGPALMQNRKPFALKNTLMVYNIAQVIYSAYLAQRYFRHLVNTDFISTQCNITDSSSLRQEILAHIYVYFLAKISELLDTVFFVLRKKNNQVTFLHVYHHSLMMVGSWAFLKFTPSESVVFMGLLNSLVHVFMYAYYGLTALGPAVAKHLNPYKKYITRLQLVQFFSIMLQFPLALKYSACPPSKGVAIFILINLIFFIYLFGSFYRQSYNKNKSKRNSVFKESFSKAVKFN